MDALRKGKTGPHLKLTRHFASDAPSASLFLALRGVMPQLLLKDCLKHHKQYLCHFKNKLLKLIF